MEGILSEVEIVHAMLQGDIVVIPAPSVDQIGPTLDLRLGTEFIIKRMDSMPHYDPREFRQIYDEDPEKIMRFYEIVKRVDPEQPFWLHPSQFAIGCTLEYVHLPAAIGADLEGTSSWAREGLNVHSTAGLIHPGHSGTITLELHNVGTHPIALYTGTRVAQLRLYRLGVPAPWAYAERKVRYAKYVAPTIGRPWEAWEFEALSERIGVRVDTGKHG